MKYFDWPDRTGPSTHSCRCTCRRSRFLRWGRFRCSPRSLRPLRCTRGTADRPRTRTGSASRIGLKVIIFLRLNNRKTLTQLPDLKKPRYWCKMNYPKKPGFNLHESRYCAFITYSVKTWSQYNLSCETLTINIYVGLEKKQNIAPGKNTKYANFKANN